MRISDWSSDVCSSDLIKPSDFYVEIPKQRVQQARLVAETLGHDLYEKFPFVEGMTPVTDDLTELVLNRTWRPQLAITGADGLPPLASAGNVLRPFTAVQLRSEERRVGKECVRKCRTR